MSRWSIGEVTNAADLVGASHLFDREVTAEGAAAFLGASGHVLLLATAEDGAIGFVSGVEMRHPDKDVELFVMELGVDERWRRQGVARSLLTALAEMGVRRGWRGIWTATEADNEPALATYRSLDASVDERSVLLEWDDMGGLRSRVTRTTSR